MKQTKQNVENVGFGSKIRKCGFEGRQGRGGGEGDGITLYFLVKYTNSWSGKQAQLISVLGACDNYALFQGSGVVNKMGQVLEYLKSMLMFFIIFRQHAKHVKTGQRINKWY